MATKQPVVSLTNVSYAYNHEKVLDGITMEIEEGEFLGLIGPNGSGKTTLLKIMLGLLKPTTGEVHLFGERVDNFTNRGWIGYVPQKASLQGSRRFPITVDEVVGLGLVSGIGSRQNDKERAMVRAALKAVGMETFRGRLLSELSGGQQQKVFIARALTRRPKLLILDEPTVGVDAESQTQFYELLKRLNTKHKLTLILVSHEIDVVAHEVGRVACLNHRLVFHGKPQEVIKPEFIAELFGSELGYIVHRH